MNPYVISPEAICDLEQIVDYLAMDNIDAGDRFIDEFSKKCRYLTQFSMIGRSYREIRPDLRGLPMKNYIIFYRCLDNGLEIMRVIQGNRDLEAVFFES